MDVIYYRGETYPKHQAIGNAAQFAIPYAKHYCKGIGYDIGCMKEEWAFPGAIPVDTVFVDGFHALSLPLQKQVDYIFSSHCLEHLKFWMDALNYWHGNLKQGGILFLYLPHYSQEYWRPWNNKKHLNIFTPEIISDWMQHRKFTNIFIGEKDLNNSFMVVGEKT